MKIGVITFPGSLDDSDARRAVTLCGGEAIALWHGDADLHGVDAVGPEDAHRPRRADGVRMQEHHDLADDLLL